MIHHDKTLNFFNQIEVKSILEKIKTFPRNDLSLELGFIGADNQFEPLSRSFFEKIHTLLKAKKTNNNNNFQAQHQQEIGTMNLKGVDGCERMKVKFSFGSKEGSRKVLRVHKSAFEFCDVLFFEELDENKENFFRIVLLTKHVTKYILHCSMLFVFDLYNFRGINIRVK